MPNEASKPPAPALIEGIDYYLENGQWIFTRACHLNRGTCCHNDCRHCPFTQNDTPAPAPESAAKIPATCPNCHTPFTCNPQKNCWCHSLTLPADSLQQLRHSFDRCLCPQCLHALTNPPHPPPPPRPPTPPPRHPAR